MSQERHSLSDNVTSVRRGGQTGQSQVVTFRYSQLTLQQFFGFFRQTTSPYKPPERFRPVVKPLFKRVFTLHSLKAIVEDAAKTYAQRYEHHADLFETISGDDYEKAICFINQLININNLSEFVTALCLGLEGDMLGNFGNYSLHTYLYCALVSELTLPDCNHDILELCRALKKKSAEADNAEGLGSANDTSPTKFGPARYAKARPIRVAGSPPSSLPHPPPSPTPTEPPTVGRG